LKAEVQMMEEMSKYFEDIVFVLENNSLIWEEMEQAEQEVKQYLKITFQEMLRNIHFEESG
jgi:hypothetical protein